MKKLAIISALALSGFAFNSASAQVHVSVGFNLGGPVVVQRPVAVYDDYYYLPEVDAYYSVGENLYYYYNGYEWVAAVYLPGAYSSYNWRNVNHIQIRANRPYLNHTVYRTKYRGTQFDWRRYDNRNDNRNNNRDWDRNPATTVPVKTEGTITARIGTEETITAMITEADALTNVTITEATITAELLCLADHRKTIAADKTGHRKMVVAEPLCLAAHHKMIAVDVEKAGHHKMIAADVETITALTLPITTAGAAEEPVHNSAISPIIYEYPKRPAVIDRGLFYLAKVYSPQKSVV